MDKDAVMQSGRPSQEGCTHLVVALFAQKELGCSIGKCAKSVVLRCLGGRRDDAGQANITNLGVPAVTCQKDVLGFQVGVDDAVGVQVIHTLGYAMGKMATLAIPAVQSPGVLHECSPQISTLETDQCIVTLLQPGCKIFAGVGLHVSWP